MGSSWTKLPTVALVTVISLLSKLSNPVTFSRNVAVTLNGALTVVGEADVKVTVGAMPSITIALEAPKELGAPGGTKVKMASPLVAFLIVPPLRDKAVVET